MFKQYLKPIGMEETLSIHLQDWPKFDTKVIDLKLEEQMSFVRDLIESIRALKEENRVRLRWPNKKIVIEPKEGMPELIFPEIIKQMGNVKELEIAESFNQRDNIVKMESRLCNIYLDLSVDDEILAERVVNDLVRNIQFSRKKKQYKVGEEISLTIGTLTDYLKQFIERHKDAISEKVTAKKLEIVQKEIESEKGSVMGDLKICPNKFCCATLKKVSTECPYCKEKLNIDQINKVEFQFKRE